jgi:hypothetical protein
MPNASVHILFFGIRNLQEVRQTFDRLRETNKAKGYIAEIIGIQMVDSKEYLLDLSGQPMVVDAMGFMEM